MASSKKKKILTKDELRRLMKQTQSGVKSQAKRIEHPLAKYNSLDRLVCSLCNCVIKNDVLWTPHLLTKQHKDRLAQKQTASYPEVPVSLKRPASQPDSCSDPKKLKDCNGSTNKLPPDFFDSSAKGNTTTTKSSLLADYESSSDSSDEDDAVSSSSTRLPADFFDNSTTDEVKEEKPKIMSEKLPEGFFDDPKLDAKVRQVEYKDKMEEEWEQFQRAMQEETHVSRVIMEEDDVQANLDRNIDEIDDQMTRWQEIEDLHVKKEVVMQKTGDGQKDEDSDEDLDESELDLFNWRAKKTWR
ncbi:zinc finger protein 830-like [Gigantopelta aegis]|uniref:zinc finger protein 830-like n=1 Tax=Gigantopelta aegis TaxID=1735272 RepID=UPI001B88BB1B|nr:zinc finger protein 830-like [Gigantopelta aegis]